MGKPALPTEREVEQLHVASQIAREPTAMARVAAIGASTPCTSRSWSPSTGWTGMLSPALENARIADASSPGWRGASMSGR